MTALFATVLRMSLGAGLTALLVLATRALLGRRPGVLMPMLYVLLLLRMVLPFSVASPFSIENLIPYPAAQAVTAFAEAPAHAASDTDAQNAVYSGDANSSGAAGAQEKEQVPRTASPALSPFETAAVVWAAGAVLSALILAAFSLRFALMLRRNRPYDSPGFDMLLASCKAELNIRRRITVVRFSGVNAAAVYGALRPKLLICPQRFEALTEPEKRSVLLHELAHIKRGDTAVCLLLGIAGVVHWFNPLVLLSLVFMRRDMEAFCDAVVLKTLDEAGRCEYAHTLLKLSENRRLRFNPALSMSGTSIKRRIIMASHYRKVSPLHAALALLLTLVIAAAGCTSAAETQPVQPEASITQPETSVSPTQAGVNASTPLSAEVTFIVAEDGTVIAINSVQGDDVILDVNLSTICISSTGGVQWQMPLESFAEGNIANMQKAAQLLDGTVIPYGDSVDLMALLGSITEADGWGTATEESWYALYYNLTSDSAEESIAPANRPGGGAEIILNLLATGAENLGCDVAIQAAGSYITGGSLIITNTQFEAGLKLCAEVRGNTLIVAVRDASQLNIKPSFTPDP